MDRSLFAHASANRNAKVTDTYRGDDILIGEIVKLNFVECRVTGLRSTARCIIASVTVLEGRKAGQTLTKRLRQDQTYNVVSFVTQEIADARHREAERQEAMWQRSIQNAREASLRGDPVRRRRDDDVSFYKHGL